MYNRSITKKSGGNKDRIIRKKENKQGKKEQGD